MKVLEINATYGYGSTGLIVRDIGELLKKNGDEVRFAYQTGQCDKTVGYHIGNPLDWKGHALFTRIFGKQGWGSKLATSKLLSYIDAEKPDVVHLHNLHANYINLPMLLKYLAKLNIPTVVSLHDCWYFTGKCCHFVLSKCQRWQTGCGHCPKIKEAPSSVFFDRSAEVAKEKRKLFQSIKNLTVVGCSKWISDMAKESFVFKDCNIEQIYNGVDTDIFNIKNRSECREKYRIHADYVMLGMANKWLDERNSDVFKSIVSKLSKNEVLILVGCTEVQKKAVEMYSNVIAIGFVSKREEMADYYNLSNVFVNLTFEDTLPTVNMESIACGTPVITYNSCGSPELVQEGKTGYIIEQLDDSALLKTWDRIKQGAIQRSDCREIGSRMFNKNDRYEDYISLFKRLLQKGDYN